ncbi:heat stress transcription factor A-2c-like isoform X3 [Amborella trichopoda]|uniref:heat stress transcription factor A-2c-like isoform X3 n=1 Tax=Amborella trichopoda TaxID=13333 RepID=UPI0009BFC6B8|nr:heat stress transcription factor A-2c-like isoform X3 [Amborella trichopoda]|eukprot:XP_020531407.1 heat stress transcription factor A-2c-like isoform X3 [Amborella trichopoda]
MESKPGVKGENQSMPHPLEALQEPAVPPFLVKIYDMVEDHGVDATVSWSQGGNTFVVWDPNEFSRIILPRYFKHNNFSSFVRQLNTYGFRKVDPDRWEFGNKFFLRGQKNLLKNIHRRKSSQVHLHPGHAYSTQLGMFGPEGKIERLRQDKNLLMLELIKLRQQQQATNVEIREMNSRLYAAEQRQQQMMSFLAKAIQSPLFLDQLTKEKERRLITSGRKKRDIPMQSPADDFSSDAYGNAGTDAEEGTHLGKDSTTEHMYSSVAGHISGGFAYPTFTGPPSSVLCHSHHVPSKGKNVVASDMNVNVGSVDFAGSSSSNEGSVSGFNYSIEQEEKLQLAFDASDGSPSLNDKFWEKFFSPAGQEYDDTGEETNFMALGSERAMSSKQSSIDDLISQMEQLAKDGHRAFDS